MNRDGRGGQNGPENAETSIFGAPTPKMTRCKASLLTHKPAASKRNTRSRRISIRAKEIMWLPLLDGKAELPDRRAMRRSGGNVLSGDIVSTQEEKHVI